MHETTVVGWDGSSTAETALEWAIARAELQPDGMRRLILVRAVDETLLEDEAQVLATAGADVAERARRMGEEHPLLDVEAIAVRGEPGDVLADRSGDEVLVVVGAENAHTEEYSHSSRLGPRLAGAADGPVAVVPIGDSLARSGVMVAVDHDAPSERLCRLAADYAADRGATLHAMHVGTRAHDVGGGRRNPQPCPRASSRRASGPRCRDARRLRPDGAGAAEARAGARDSVRGLPPVGAVRRMFLGSVSHSLVTNARCATVVVPPVGGPHSHPDVPQA